MSDSLIFYTNPMSRGRIARWMLEELGVSYEAKVLTWGAHKSPDYLAINPMGKVPTLVHGDTVITECAAICAYLADLYPEKGLAPPVGSKERGTYYRWMFFAAGPIEAALSDKSLGLAIPDDKKGQVGYGSFEDMLKGIDHAIAQGDYILGDHFSAADVYFGSELGWGMMFGSIEATPERAAYVGRLRARPAAIKAAAIDDALIAESKSKESNA